MKNKQNKKENEKKLKKKRTFPSDAVLLRKKRYIYSMKESGKSMTENSKVPLFLQHFFFHIFILCFFYFCSEAFVEGKTGN